MVEKRYRALRVIATICRVAGAIMGVLVVLAALGICLNLVFGVSAITLFEPEHPFSRPRFLPWWWGWGTGPGFAVIPGVGGLILAGLIILGGGLQALLWYGFGELIYLLLALEENTRAAATALQRHN
ncbi:MAG: hypothetical protein DDG58_08985 [Ardenticatenia bacterium]|nr:MAG: hypothetical protein DDG58_08985 [Ardenticatenia bacterium]